MTTTTVLCCSPTLEILSRLLVTMDCFGMLIIGENLVCAWGSDGLRGAGPEHFHFPPGTAHPVQYNGA